MLFVGAAGSQAYVQVFNAGEILAKGERRAHGGYGANGIRLASIYSSDGKIVAQSRDVYTLSLHYKNVPQSRAFYTELAAASGLPMTELLPGDDEVSGREWRASLSPLQKQRVQAVQSRWDVDGISLTPSLSRIYPLGEAASGFVGTVRYAEPVNGLEMSFNPLLRGEAPQPGLFAGLDAAVAKSATAESQAAGVGAPVTLTIDSRVQIAAAQAIKKTVEANDAKRGCALVLDPKTGDLVAMANWPSYDPDGNIGLGSDFNASYMAAYEPGSTFKLLTLAIGMDVDKVHADDHYMSTSSIRINGLPVSNHEGHAYGNITPREAIAYSCNVTAAKWAMDIGKETMEKYTDRLGLFKKGGLGVPGERAGMRADSEYAQKHLVATWGFGQSMNITPVSLIGAFGALANDGMMMQPRLVKAIGTTPIEPVNSGQIFKPGVGREVVEIARSVFEEGGTGADLRVDGLDLAGKTGTAQALRSAGGEMRYVSSFVGFAPASDPKYVILVMVENPKAGTYYGSSVAGPAFVDIATRMRDLDMIPRSRAPRQKPKNTNDDAEQPQPTAD